MTKKDYVAIANIVKGAQHVHLTKGTRIAYLARCLADVLARDNPEFDRARFLSACGVQ